MNLILKYYEWLTDKSSSSHVIVVLFLYCFVKSLCTLHHQRGLKVSFNNNKGIIRTVLKILRWSIVFVLNLCPTTCETCKSSGCGLPLMMSLVFQDRFDKCEVGSTLSVLVILRIKRPYP